MSTTAVADKDAEGRTLCAPTGRGAQRAPLNLRPLAIPNEHGGWGFLFEPIVLALIVAPSTAGTLVGVAAVAAFLARHPFKIAASDFLRRRRYPRTAACRTLAAAYGAVALLATIAAVRLAGPALLLPMAVAAPLGIVQLAYDARNRGRAVLPELAGAIAMATVAASIAIAGAAPLPLAAALCTFALCRSVSAIVYVRAMLRSGARSAIAVHIAAVVIVALLWRASLAPLVAVMAMLLLLGRAVAGLRRASKPAPKRVGVAELVWGGVTTIATALAYAA